MLTERKITSATMMKSLQTVITDAMNLLVSDACGRRKARVPLLATATAAGINDIVVSRTIALGTDDDGGARERTERVFESDIESGSMERVYACMEDQDNELLERQYYRAVSLRSFSSLPAKSVESEGAETSSPIVNLQMENRDQEMHMITTQDKEKFESGAIERVCAGLTDDQDELVDGRSHAVSLRSFLSLPAEESVVLEGTKVTASTITNLQMENGDPERRKTTTIKGTSKPKSEPSEAPYNGFVYKNKPISWADYDDVETPDDWYADEGPSSILKTEDEAENKEESLALAGDLAETKGKTEDLSDLVNLTKTEDEAEDMTGLAEKKDKTEESSGLAEAESKGGDLSVLAEKKDKAEDWSTVSEAESKGGDLSDLAKKKDKAEGSSSVEETKEKAEEFKSVQAAEMTGLDQAEAIEAQQYVGMSVTDGGMARSTRDPRKRKARSLKTGLRIIAVGLIVVFGRLCGVHLRRKGDTRSTKLSLNPSLQVLMAQGSPHPAPAEMADCFVGEPAADGHDAAAISGGHIPAESLMLFFEYIELEATGLVSVGIICDIQTSRDMAASDISLNDFDSLFASRTTHLADVTLDLGYDAYAAQPVVTVGFGDGRFSVTAICSVHPVSARVVPDASRLRSASAGMASTIVEYFDFAEIPSDTVLSIDNCQDRVAIAALDHSLAPSSPIDSSCHGEAALAPNAPSDLSPVTVVKVSPGLGVPVHTGSTATRPLSVKSIQAVQQLANTMQRRVDDASQLEEDFDLQVYFMYLENEESADVFVSIDCGYYGVEFISPSLAAWRSHRDQKNQVAYFSQTTVFADVVLARSRGIDSRQLITLGFANGRHSVTVECSDRPSSFSTSANLSSASKQVADNTSMNRPPGGRSVAKVRFKPAQCPRSSPVIRDVSESASDGKMEVLSCGDLLGNLSEDAAACLLGFLILGNRFREALRPPPLRDKAMVNYQTVSRSMLAACAAEQIARKPPCIRQEGLFLALGGRLAQRDSNIYLESLRPPPERDKVSLPRLQCGLLTEEKIVVAGRPPWKPPWRDGDLEMTKIVSLHIWWDKDRIHV